MSNFEGFSSFSTRKRQAFPPTPFLPIAFEQILGESRIGSETAYSAYLVRFFFFDLWIRFGRIIEKV